MRRQSGFTLIEIAIVLVIIGLLLGGILKGQEMIENAKVKSAVNDLNGVVAAFNAYRDRYRAIPGDDNNNGGGVAGRGGSWAGLPSGNGDGIVFVQAVWTFTGGGEGANFFRHLRAAGFLSGSPAAVGVQALPRNPFNGLTGVTNASVMNNLLGLKVCMSQVPGRAAVALDNQLDDGRPDFGTLRAAVSAPGVNTPPGVGAALTYNEDRFYTICRTI